MSMSDPLVNFTFALEIQGVQQGYFREASGFDSENEVVESRHVLPNGQQVIRKQPGQLKWANIVLKRGLTDSLELYKWRKKVEQGDVVGARVSGSVVVYDHMYKEVARFNFVNGWPAKWKGGEFNATANEIVVEEIEIAHEGLERVT